MQRHITEKARVNIRAYIIRNERIYIEIKLRRKIQNRTFFVLDNY